MSNRSILAAVRHRDCKVSWESLAFLGTKIHLLQVETIVTPLSPLPAQQILPDMDFPKGLTNISHIELTFLNISSSLNIEPYLPAADTPLGAVGSLSIQCYEKENISGSRCQRHPVTLNHQNLPGLFPRLQSLTLSGVIPQNNSSSLAFPWDSSTMMLPLNLTYSKFHRHLYSGEFKIQSEDFRFTRSLVLVGRIPFDICQICPYVKQLDTLVIRSNRYSTVPSNCFWPGNGTSSLLSYLDLTSNHIVKIPLSVFKGLHSLIELQLSSNRLTEYEVGLFDDLTSLMILNLDRNNVSEIKAGTFTQLISLKKLYMHDNNNLAVIEPGSLPTFSHNLTFLDFRWCDLEKLPFDCITLPNLDLCDCDHNKRLSISNLSEIISYFDPIKMYLVQPLAYYRETFSHSDVGLMHETDQSEISLRDCAVTSIDFSNSWSQ